MIRFVLLSCALVVLWGQQAQAQSYQSVPGKEFAQLIAKVDNVQLIDIRTPGEYASGHIKGARNIDFYSGTFSSQMDKLDRNKPVFIYCRSGSRSTMAARRLSANGFTQLYELQYGIASNTGLLAR